jgi:hypothetical protein
VPLTFGGVTSILAQGTSDDDTLQVSGPLAPALTFSNGNGRDSIEVVGGTYTFASDLNPSLKNIAVTVDAGATAIFATTQHLGDLTVNGTASVPANGGRALVATSLTVSGKLDIADNDLVIDYSTLSPVGVWTGSAYDGVSGMIASGRNGGAWDGSGIVSSSATGNLTTLGVADAGELFSISGTQTHLFGDESIDATSVLVKYTYSGDANLDGKIDIDDYGRVDVSEGVGASGWFNGDFNYDGTINVDDYAIIDVNVISQGALL